MKPRSGSSSLTPAIADEGKLVTIIDEFVRSDPVAASLQTKVAALSADLHDRTDADARDNFLRLDETINERTAHITLALFRWAFREGYGRGFDDGSSRRSGVGAREGHRRHRRPGGHQ